MIAAYYAAFMDTEHREARLIPERKAAPKSMR